MKTLLALGSMFALATSAFAGTVLTFSEPDFDWLSQGSGTPYHVWIAGDYWRQPFAATGLASANGISLDLVITDDNALSQEGMSFDVLVNGTDVGDFALLANTPGLYQFSYSFPDIAGDDYLIELVGSSTISPGAGSFSLELGPSFATLVPEPSALVALGFLSVFAVCRRR